MTQSVAREKIKQLVDKFRREQAAGKISQYNSPKLRTGFRKEDYNVIYSGSPYQRSFQ
jgi:hypothetical protein